MVFYVFSAQKSVFTKFLYLTNFAQHSFHLVLILRVISARALEYGAFSLRLDLGEDVNRHFPDNYYGDLSFFLHY